MPSRNYGLIIEPIIANQDFILGSDRSLSNKFSGRTIINETGDWSKYMENEPQAPVYETNSCATFGTLTALEALKRFLFKHEPDFSDRFVAKGSGTDPLRGNTPKAPAEFIRKNWTVFEQEWPASAAKTVEEFFADLPKNLRTLAIGRGAEWDFGYEYIPTTVHGIKAALLLGTAAMSVPAWFKDENGEYYRPKGVQDGHWVAIQKVLDGNRILIKDTYEPYDKIMRADYTPQVAMGYYLNRQIKQESAWAQFLAWLHKLVFTNENDATLIIDHTSPTIPTEPPPKYLWDTPQNTRHSIRVICDEEGLTLEEKNTLCATVGGESGWDNNAINHNKNSKGQVVSTDYGVAQINDFYHIGEGKSFPSVTYVNSNPEKVIRWMCKQWKLGNRNWWIAYKSGSYKKHL